MEDIITHRSSYLFPFNDIAGIIYNFNLTARIYDKIV